MIVRILKTLFLAALFGAVVSAQGTFTPRDADESEAWTI